MNVEAMLEKLATVKDQIEVLQGDHGLTLDQIVDLTGLEKDVPVSHNMYVADIADADFVYRSGARFECR